MTGILEIAAIEHVQVAIPAGGEDSARAFYGQLLELPEIGKPENLRSRGGVWCQSSSLQLHLGVDPQFCPATKAHVALRVVNLEAVRKGLTAAGYVTKEDEPLPGYRRFYVNDPCGKRTEILQPDQAR